MSSISAGFTSNNKFAGFTISTYEYKVVDDHPILVDVAIPKELLNEQADAKRKVPVCVEIHGGWLVGGQRNFPDWNISWVVQTVLKHRTIYVQPDHRLLPEANAEEILDDIDDFWVWLEKTLPSILQQQGVEGDFDRVLVVGESAGGYLAIQTALSYGVPTSNQSLRIRAVVPHFPLLDLQSTYYSQAFDKPMLGLPQMPKSIIDDHLASIASATKKPVVTNAPMIELPRGALAIALVQHGRYAEVFGEERDPAPGKRRLHPEERIADGRKLPPTLLLHGIEDSAVPIRGSDAFIELLKEKRAVYGLEDGKEDEVLRYVRVPGDHGFDNDMMVGDEEWIDGAVSFIEKHWLQ